MGVDHLPSEEEALASCKWKKRVLGSSPQAPPGGERPRNLAGWCRHPLAQRASTDRHGKTVRTREAASSQGPGEPRVPASRPQARVCPLHKVFLGWGPAGFSVRKVSPRRTFPVHHHVLFFRAVCLLCRNGKLSQFLSPNQAYDSGASNTSLLLCQAPVFASLLNDLKSLFRSDRVGVCG